jgi:hypothetical protein
MSNNIIDIELPMEKTGYISRLTSPLIDVASIHRSPKLLILSCFALLSFDIDSTSVSAQLRLQI